ncbi:hypothetical protein Q1695_012968 [Nippostrongylus brasiliensis]|nr:hypothetical protein Q1695_012968 [Nippostrongylus brasiliensis]
MNDEKVLSPDVCQHRKRMRATAAVSVQPLGKVAADQRLMRFHFERNGIADDVLRRPKIWPSTSNDFEWLFDGIGNVGIWRGDHKYKTRVANFCLGLWVQDSKFGEKQCIDNFDKYKASDFQQGLLI